MLELISIKKNKRKEIKIRRCLCYGTILHGASVDRLSINVICLNPFDYPSFGYIFLVSQVQRAHYTSVNILNLVYLSCFLKQG